MGKRRQRKMAKKNGNGKKLFKRDSGPKDTFVSGLIGQVIGGTLMLFALILFGIAISQLDGAYTSAIAYDQVGLTDIMGIFGMVLFLVFVGAGVAVLGGTAVYIYSKSVSGGWMGAFLGFAFATVGLVIALILNTILQSQLNTQQVAINALSNVSNFPGLYDISRIWGMIIFLSLLAPGIAGISGSVVGAIGKIRGGIGS